MSDPSDNRVDDDAAPSVPTRPMSRLPLALDQEPEIARRLLEGKPAVFLDYDGTLTPIVDDPAQALLPEQTRAVVQRLAGLCTVAVISGRDLADVRSMVGIPGIAYSGSHGFDMVGPDGTPLQPEQWARFLPILDRAEKELATVVAEFTGARVERKRFAIAVHYRIADEPLVDALEEQVNEVAARHWELRKTGGKKVFELRPQVDWNKGRALLFLLENLNVRDGRVVPLFIGDDVTDEDAFAAIREQGISIVVGREDRVTAAHYALRDPDEAREFLEGLAALLERTGG